MIKAECDRCGTQEQTPAVSGRVTLGMRVETPLPEDWREVALRDAVNDMVEPRRWQLCAGCVNAFLSFFDGDGAVPGLLEPEALEAVMKPPCADGKHITTPETHPRCASCGKTPFETDDPRPNLTARARKLAEGGKSRHCTCAGVGSGTEDCAVHHPDGIEQGTHLKCYQDPDGRECPGLFRRGMFNEHMQRWHGIPVAKGSVQCAFCATIEPGWKIGAHIAAEHPGDWQAWIDGGQKAG